MSPHFVWTRSALRVALVGALLTVAVPRLQAQTNSFITEAPIAAIPLDVEVTPNGAVAVVRGNDTTFQASQPNNARVSF